MMVLVRHHSKTVLWFLDVTEMINNELPPHPIVIGLHERNFALQHLFLFVSFRNDGSIFDGLVEEDDKDKAKR